MEHLRILSGAGLLAGILIGPVVALGTVQEQRERLPAPKECVDPVQGVWKSHQWSAPHKQWTEFKLYIRQDRENPGTLRGTIENHSWEGDKSNPQPGPCEGQLRYLVSMTGEGTLTGNDVVFRGVGQWRLDKTLCGSFLFGYNLDEFTGTIDHELQEFQSVNNDGGLAVNEPTVFRRIDCFDDEVDPTSDVAPPPYTPPRLGCGWW